MTDKEIHNHCRKYLPHIENQRYQMITYRLYDSVPREVIEQWKLEVEASMQPSHPPNHIGMQPSRLPNHIGKQASRLRDNTAPTTGMQSSRLPNHIGKQPSHLPNSTDVSFGVQDSSLYNQLDSSLHSINSNLRKKLALIDKYEDTGYGQCFMRDDKVAKIVKNALFYHDGSKYKIIAWCIMPNHVHTLIEVFNGYSLSEIIHSWKSFSAHQINKLLNRTGQVWMMEYYDRYIRDNNHYENVVNYIHNNPVKAGLVNNPSEYRWSSAYEEDE